MVLFFLFVVTHGQLESKSRNVNWKVSKGNHHGVYAILSSMMTSCLAHQLGMWPLLPVYPLCICCPPPSRLVTLSVIRLTWHYYHAVLKQPFYFIMTQSTRIWRSRYVQDKLRSASFKNSLPSSLQEQRACSDVTHRIAGCCDCLILYPLHLLLLQVYKLV